MSQTPPAPDDLKARFRAFRAGTTGERLFVCPVTMPHHELGLCFCDAPLWKALGFYLKAGLAGWILKGPFNAPKLWILRRLGARIGRNVHIANDVWIDPLFPDLLEIEDDVIVGVGARIAFHTCSATTFTVGRVRIGQGAVIGGFALLAPGVSVGPHATVAAAAAVGRDVPAHATALGNPARILRKAPAGNPV